LRIDQFRWTVGGGWEPRRPGAADADLLLVFGATDRLREPGPYEEACAAYPGAFRFGCSTAGDIYDTQVSDDSLVVTAVRFAATRIVGVCTADLEDSFRAGERLAAALDPEGLVHVFVVTDGLHVNGSALVKGLAGGLPHGVTVTGGLSGDGSRFRETLVVCGGEPAAGTAGALGFYGPGLQVGYSSLGGWDAFGPERLITRSQGNVLYELDGRSALELYKTYLGPHAADLPASALLFPLSLRTEPGDTPLVRTILGVSEEESSMTFAGDMPVGTYARLMRANFDRLIDGAAGAARTSCGAVSPELALLVSCVGRKLVLGQRVEEEVEAVREVLGRGAVLAGFYSYGEISPFTPSARCELHNQTMTITTLAEP